MKYKYTANVDFYEVKKEDVEYTLIYYVNVLGLNLDIIQSKNKVFCFYGGELLIILKII